MHNTRLKRYEEYVPVRKRRAMEEAKLRQLRGLRAAGAGAGGGGSGSDEDGGGAGGGGGGGDAAAGGDGGGGRPQSAAAQQRAKESLLVSAARARAAAPEQTVEERVVAEEQDIMRHLMQKQALKAVQELAQGVSYTKSMQTGWKAPLAARRMSQRRQQVRLLCVVCCVYCVVCIVFCVGRPTHTHSFLHQRAIHPSPLSPTHTHKHTHHKNNQPNHDEHSK